VARSVRDVYLNVFQRSQHEIGRLWQMNQITVAQEHYCTAATQWIMVQLYPYVFGTERIGRRLVAAETGGQLSHSAIVAREYGLPAVVGVRDAIRLIREGQFVVVDGTAGTVHLE